MQCQICGKVPATVHYTEIVNDKMTELHVCEVRGREGGFTVSSDSQSAISGRWSG
jgi:protein arginine kinase activator